MNEAIKPSVTIRPAQESDLSALTAIKGAGSEALHLDRIRDAENGDFQYLVALDGSERVGFGLLVFRRPAHWSDAADSTCLPQIVDLQVREDLRGRGYGSAFMEGLERITAEAGYDELYLSVEPDDNPRAYALYRRLGYEPLQPKPYPKSWHFVDSDGKEHRGKELIIDMVKRVGKVPKGVGNTF